MARIDNFDMANFRRRVTETVQLKAIRDAIFELLKFAEDNADVIQGGSSTSGSFHYRINVSNQTKTLFTCDGSGYVSVSLGSFAGAIPVRPIVPGPLIARLRSELARIPGFESFSKDYPYRPGFEIARTIVDSNVMARFKKAVLKFQKSAQAP